METQPNLNDQSIPLIIQPRKKIWLIAALVAGGVFILGGAAYGGYYWWQNYGGAQKACTMEAKLCPDGSSVGRVGPNCEFAACPSASPSSDPTAGLSSEALATEGWQTYRNEEYGFEVKYPSVAVLGQYSDFGVNAEKIIEWANSLNSKCIVGLGVLGWGPPFIWTKETTDFSVAGQKYRRNIWTEDGKAVWASTVFKKDSSEFSIDLKPPSNGYEECLSTYDQILSTFKFTK